MVSVIFFGFYKYIGYNFVFCVVCFFNNFFEKEFRDFFINYFCVREGRIDMFRFLCLIWNFRFKFNVVMFYSIKYKGVIS